MSVNTTPIYVGVFFDQNTAIAAADTTTVKNVMDAHATLDRRVDVLNLSTDDTAVKLFNVLMHDGVTAQIIANVPSAVTAGTTALGATPALNILSHANMAGIVKTDAAGNKFILVPAGSKLQVGAVATLTSGKTAWIYCQGGNF